MFEIPADHNIYAIYGGYCYMQGISLPSLGNNACFYIRFL